MIRLYASLSLLALALLSACTQQPDPNARKVLEACLAVSAADATAILGQPLTANKMSGDDAPISICSYNDPGNSSVGLVKLQSADKIKDQQANLASDMEMLKGVYKGNVKPVVARPAEGFSPGSFYMDITPGLGDIEVQLYTIEDGYKLIVVVNQSKDFPTAEKQAEGLAKKVAESLQNGTAFQPG
jgi:hypothetical protein